MGAVTFSVITLLMDEPFSVFGCGHQSQPFCPNWSWSLLANKLGVVSQESRTVLQSARDEQRQDENLNSLLPWRLVL